MEAENLAGVNLTHLFAADVILPVQVVHPPPDRWLHRLCLTILEDALKYLEVRGGYGGPRARARQRQETWEWFLSDADYCFSFTTVCSVLNLNVEAVRRAVRRRLRRAVLPCLMCLADYGNLSLVSPRQAA